MALDNPGFCECDKPGGPCDYHKALEQLALLFGRTEWDYPGQAVTAVEEKLKPIPRVTVQTTVTVPGDNDG